MLAALGVWRRARRRHRVTVGFGLAHRLRPRGERRRPARRDRALRPAAHGGGRRARARRCRTSQARSYRFEIHDVPLRRPPALAAHGRGCSTSCSAAAAATRSSPATTSRRGRARWWSSAAWRRRVGPAASATGCESAAARPAARGRDRGLAGQRRLPAGARRARLRRPRRGAARRSAGGRTARPTSRCCGSTTRARTDVTLTQARAVAFGIGDLRFITRDGRASLLIDQAAGDRDRAAGRVLARRARRRRGRCSPPARTPTSSGGCRRSASSARSASRPAAVAAQQALEALRGRRSRAAARARRSARSSSPAPPRRCSRRSTSCRRAPRCSARSRSPASSSCASSSPRATWPAWRAARRPPTAILRGGDLAPPPRTPAGRPRGLRVDRARRRAFALAPPRDRRAGRWLAAVATIAVCAGVVLLMLALASLLVAPARRPGHARQALPARRRSATATLVPERRRRPGRRRRRRRATRSTPPTPSALGEPLRLIAYPGDHTRFEAPPLPRAGGCARRREAEVGAGLADALGLHPGSTLAVAAPRRRRGALPVVGDRARARERRPDRLGAAAPAARAPIPTSAPQVVDPPERRGADRAASPRELRALGAGRSPSARRDPSNAAFLGVLAGGAARRRARGRARLPVRARPGAGHDRARAARRGRAPARHRRGRARPSASCWPARRSPSRCPPRSLAIVLELVVLGPAVSRARRGLRRAAAGATARPGRARRRRPARAGRGRHRCSSRAGSCASRSSRGCGRSDARRPLRRPSSPPSRPPCSRSPACGRPPAPGPPAARRCRPTLVDPRRRRRSSSPGPGEPLRDRGGAAARPAATLATFAPDHRHPRARRGVAGARAVPRPPRRRRSRSTFRPQEALSAAGARRRRPRARPRSARTRSS